MTLSDKIDYQITYCPTTEEYLDGEDFISVDDIKEFIQQLREVLGAKYCDEEMINIIDKLVGSEFLNKTNENKNGKY